MDRRDALRTLATIALTGAAHDAGTRSGERCEVGRHDLSHARPHRREGVGDRARRPPHRPPQGGGRGHPHHPDARSIAASRSWTTAGTTTTARANAGWATRCATASARSVFLMTKFDGRTKAVDGDADRRIAEAAADRRHRSDAVSRDHPHGGPGSLLRHRRSAGGAARGKEGGQDPLHRLHRPQGSACTCGCWKWPPQHKFHFDAARCRSTCWTRTSAASSTESCRGWCRMASACSA